MFFIKFLDAVHFGKFHTQFKIQDSVAVVHYNFFLIHQIWDTNRSKVVFLLWIIYVFFCLVFVMPLCASVYLCLVVNCWEKADLLAFSCGV